MIRKVHAPSLQARITILTVAVTTSLVGALLLVQLNNVVELWLNSSLGVAEIAGQQVKTLLLLRLQERTPPSGRGGAERRQAWVNIVKNDGNLTLLLETTMAQSRSIIEISITGENGNVIASSNPMRPGTLMVRRPSVRSLISTNPLQRITRVLTRGQDFELTIPLGVEGEARPLFTIQTLVSWVLLREDLVPAMRRVALWGMAAVLASIVLAYVSSRLVVRNIGRLDAVIDRISSGEAGKLADETTGAAREFAVIESKLSILGHRFRGAVEGATELRNNVKKLLDHLEEAILLFDPAGRLILAGGAAARILRLPVDAATGRLMTEIFPTNTLLGSFLREACVLDKGVQEQRIGRLLVTVELIPASPDHAARMALVRIRDAAGPQQLESQLQLSARLDAMHRLIGSVAHEVKNPLNSIAVRLDYLQSWAATASPEAEEEVQVIVEEVNRLDRVVRNFLDFTRPVELVRERLDMVALSREVAELVQPDAERRGVSIRFDSARPSVPVCGDPDLLKEAIMNVVTNGIEAMPSGGELDIAVSEADMQCRITIRDTGPGIPAGQREKVFELYFSTKAKGSGLGLPMAYRALQLHGGSIDLASEPGKGTSFHLKLPVMESEGIA
uniref:histidine kinase n=1 Tax=Solibacter usitatus (strain Ellin6076) TaxID=234267 RepID=Q01RL5_SOLUE